jgi:hypothetical protein
MKLITTEHHTQLLANAHAARNAAHAGRDIDLTLTPVVKLVVRGHCKRWLLTEIDFIDSDRAYGLVDPGDGRPYLGFVSLQGLDNYRSELGRPVERDLHFVADKPLSAYAEIAYTRGLIIT